MRAITRIVPASLRPLARSWYYSALELLDRRPSRKNSLYAPAELDFVTGGTEDFKEGAKRFLDCLIESGLKPDDHVLDVGCGIGRLAAPLTQYLSGEGSYRGFDLVEIGVRWATNHITRQYPNFIFERADVYSEMYHPEGRVRAGEYRFPYADASFDRVFAYSLFTHMLPDDMRNYLREIARVIKPDGCALITYFLLDDNSREALANGRCAISFQPYLPECLTRNVELPESALCYFEAAVKRAHCEAGLKIERVSYGSWRGGSSRAFQDITVSGKRVI